MNKSKIISQQEEKAIKRNNTSIRVVQGLCLALILVIQYTVSMVHLPRAVFNQKLSSYIPESFLVMQQ